MVATAYLALDIVALISFVFLVNKIRNRKKGRLLYPPGPKPLPVIGNLLDVPGPKEHSWITYAEWAKRYGDVVSMQILGKVIVILHSNEAARELLDKRAAIYSDRPSIPFWELMNWTWLLFVIPYSQRWRIRRRMLDRGLRPSAALQYRPMQKQKVHYFLKQLLVRPEGFRRHLEYLQASIMLSIAYGYDVRDEHDRFLKVVVDANVLGGTTILPGSVIVNSLPFLKRFPGWLPGMGFQSLAKVGRKLGEEMVQAPFNFVKESMNKGSASPSVTFDNLQELDPNLDPSEYEDAERAIAEASGSIYIAGADSTVSTLASIFLVLAINPDIQKKAQTEIDSVTGGVRLPDYDDRARLPYINAMCTELLRWKQVGPLDDVYDGHFIPKGATVFANLWAILHDHNVYPEPEEFVPERFLNDDGRGKVDSVLATAFGYGKRICPGRHLVDSTIFILVASILATFNIRKANDAEGNEIPIRCEFTGGALSHPKAFECSITSRSAKADELITAATWV
ncbi:cytochrome P450 [Artomyces pyxidatus]|uniref:Cytochrome P450 n=1 Tax=Artomyces pyxidatus TaxID=48021 RepID=A0ACB8TDV3_9AGAM|nr:cytochrome P450 [Artomyces pyxidatus]